MEAEGNSGFVEGNQTTSTLNDPDWAAFLEHLTLLSYSLRTLTASPSGYVTKKRTYLIRLEVQSLIQDTDTIWLCRS
jgi:hypothetical protein